MAKTEKAPNFTEAQEARIREVAASGPDGKLNLDLAKSLADEMGKGYRSIIAKAVRMEVPYATKEPTAKDGSPITKKADLVAKIAAVVSGNLDGLEKAPKPALVALASFVASQRG